MTAGDSQEALAGQAVYSRAVLSVYDIWVLGLSNRFIWRCPTPRQLEHYNRHISDRHLDVGVGTGYFLDRCTMPAKPHIALIDLNRNSLDATAQRIRRYQPVSYRRNILEKLELDCEPFASIGLNYLFHCLPGTLHNKAVVFDNLAPYLEPGGIMFGATLLHDGVRRNAAARRLMKVYNAKGIFSNENDSLATLEKELSQRFAQSGIEVIGCGALFWGRTAAPDT